MAKEPDFSKFASPGKNRGQAPGFRSPGTARNPLNQHSSRMLERVVDLQEAAKKWILSPQEFERAAEAVGEFKAAEQTMARLKKGGDPMLAETAKFTRRGQAGTIDPKTLKKVGLPAGASFEEIAAKASRVFEELRKGPLGATMKASAKQLPKGSAILKSRIFPLLKGMGLAGAVGAALPAASAAAEAMMLKELSEEVKQKMLVDRIRKEGA